MWEGDIEWHPPRCKRLKHVGIGHAHGDLVQDHIVTDTYSPGTMPTPIGFAVFCRAKFVLRCNSEVVGAAHPSKVSGSE